MEGRAIPAAIAGYVVAALSSGLGLVLLTELVDGSGPWTLAEPRKALQDALLISGVTGLLGLPSFLLVRIGLALLNQRSVIAFAVGGVLASIAAQIMVFQTVMTLAVLVGGISGVIYRLVECAILHLPVLRPRIKS
jgi:hypothetical protein